jgi:hypothetical protein
MRRVGFEYTILEIELLKTVCVSHCAAVVIGEVGPEQSFMPLFLNWSDSTVG